MRFQEAKVILRTTAALFVVFAMANGFFMWSAALWWPSPRHALAKYVLLPLALLAWLPQALSYVLFDYLEVRHSYGGLGSCLMISAISTGQYTLLAIWLHRRGQSRISGFLRRSKCRG